jgi:hypothetical protein
VQAETSQAQRGNVLLKKKNQDQAGSAFDGFAEILGFPAPAIDPSSGFPVIKGSIIGCDFEITASNTNQATQTTITIKNPPDVSLTFQILGGHWFEKGGITTQIPTFDSQVACKSNNSGQLLKIIQDESIRLCIQALGDCLFEFKKDGFQFVEQLDFSPNQFPKYMNVVSIMVRVIAWVKSLNASEGNAA